MSRNRKKGPIVIKRTAAQPAIYRTKKFLRAWARGWREELFESVKLGESDRLVAICARHFVAATLNLPKSQRRRTR